MSRTTLALALVMAAIVGIGSKARAQVRDTVRVTLPSVVVSSTRIERRIEDEPERVEVLAGEDIDEKSQMRPGDIATLVREIPGVHVVSTSSASGGAGFRLRGLRAHYGALLSDGLPLHGVENAELGPLQIPPLDLAQVEVLKGPVAALYGPAAFSGAMNLISRRPGDTPERSVLLNQTSRGGSDATVWLAGREGERWGTTLAGGFHHQSLGDVDHDGWADLQHYSRVELRPRVFWDGGDGRSAFATIGATTESRNGGGDGELREDADSRRADLGLRGRMPLGAGFVELRSSWNGAWTRRVEPDPAVAPLPLRERLGTAFAELTITRPSARAVWLVGIAYEHDAHRVEELPDLDYAHDVPAVLGQLGWMVAPWLSGSLAGRVDAHSHYGTIGSPRASLLAHAGHAFEARVSAGAGFFGPTAFGEQTIELPLRRVRPLVDVRTERARNVSLDLTARRGALELDASMFATDHERAALLGEPSLDSSGFPRVSILNAAQPSRTRGLETYAFYAREPLTITVDYAYLDATEVAPGSVSRAEVPLTPRQTGALDVAWEEDESGTRVGVEVFYSGSMRLEHDPYRSTSAPFATIGVLASQRIGRAQLFLDGENLGDVRQSSYEPMLLPAPDPAGRLAVDAWAPREGVVVNGGVRLEF